MTRQISRRELRSFAVSAWGDIKTAARADKPGLTAVNAHLILASGSQMIYTNMSSQKEPSRGLEFYSS
jgi:hypothetical protein